MAQKVDLSFLPDQFNGKSSETDLSFLPDQPKSKVDLSFLPDQPTVSKLEKKITYTLPALLESRLLPTSKEEPITTGLFGTHIGETSPLLAALREPAIKAREGLRMITGIIPKTIEAMKKAPTYREPLFERPEEKPSVISEFIRGTPEVLTQIGSEFAAGTIEPESLAMIGISGFMAPVKKTKLWDKAIEKITESMPPKLRRMFTYRGDRPQEYMQLRENLESETLAGIERARIIGQSLQEGLRPAQRIRAGQIIQGGISVSDREAPLRVISLTAKEALKRGEISAKQVNLLGEETYFTKLSRARVNELNLQKNALENQIDDVLGLPQKKQLEVLVSQLGIDKEKISKQILDFRSAIKNSRDLTTEDMYNLGKKVVDKYDFMADKIEKIANIPTNRQFQLKTLVDSFRNANDTEKSQLLDQILKLSDRFKLSDELAKRQMIKRIDSLSTVVDKLEIGGFNQLENFADNFQTRFRGRAGIINTIKSGIDEIDERLWINRLHGGEPYFPRLYKEKEIGLLTKAREFFGFKPIKIKGEAFMKRALEPVNPQDVIKEPAYPVAKRLAQVTSDVETAKFATTIAQNPEWSSDVPKEGFVKIKGTSKTIGALADKYVHPAIADDINSIIRIPSMTEDFMSGVVSKWKFGKVVLNPASHFRNMMSNSIMLDASGVDYFQQPALLRKSLLELRNKGNYFQEAYSERLLGQEFIGGELKDFLDVIEEPGVGLYGKFLNIVKKRAGDLGKVYQAEEQWFKLAKFISEREKGVGIKAAAKEAEKWLFNYSKISPFIRGVRTSPVGAPFITYTSKAFPRIIETAVTDPAKLYKYKILFDSFETVAKERLGITDNEIDTIKRNARGQVLIMPWRDHQGNLQTLDLSYILPWGDIGERGGLFGLAPSISPGGIVKSIAEVGFNKSAFTEKSIYLDTDTKAQALTKSVDYLYKSWFPSVFPGGYSETKLRKAIQGTPDYFGRVRGVSTVLADVIFGLKVSPADPKIMLNFEKLGIRQQLEEIKKELFSKRANKGLTEEQKIEAEKIAKDKVEALLKNASEIK